VNSHTDLNRSADINIQLIDAALQDFEVSVVRAWHIKVGKLVRRARQPMTDQQVTAVSFAFANLDCASGLHGWHHGGICLGLSVTTDESSVAVGDFHGSQSFTGRGDFEFNLNH
jgi:hypothetical protein